MNYIDALQNFTGRRFKLDLLKRRVKDLRDGYRQNLAILGDQYMGKSTILRKFVHEMDNEKVIPIYLDLHNKDTHYFFYKYMTSLLYSFAKMKKLKLDTDLKQLLLITYQYIPQTAQSIEKIRALYESNKLLLAFNDLISLPDIFFEETGIMCTLIFDEFHELEEWGLASAFEDLGTKIMTQKHCFYILTSSFEEKARKIINDKLSLLFGNFEIIYVDLFDLQTSLDHIDRVLVNVRMGLQLKNFLADYTGGHPLYLNLILNELNSLSAIHKQNEVYVPLLTQAIENVVFNQWGVLSRHFELIVNQLCSGKGNRVTAALLISLANGRHKINDLIDYLEIRKSQINPRLKFLVENNVIAKNGTYFYLKDKLLRYWIKYVYQRRVKSVDLEPDREFRMFKEDLNQAVTNFQLMSRQGLPDRVKDLMRSFNNEVLSINGRKYRLPQFTDLKIERLNNGSGTSFEVIRGEADQDNWLVVLKKEPLSDKDISDLIIHRKNECKRSDRCVVVALSELDETAKVRVLQERMWLWNESELNKLMNLYDKPYIV